jgi:hypothetical protein
LRGQLKHRGEIRIRIDKIQIEPETERTSSRFFDRGRHESDGPESKISYGENTKTERQRVPKR